MSKLRSISTSFWSDPFIEDLSVSEKLLYLYLITNEKTNMLGIYEVSIRKISFETGIDKPTVEKALKHFETLGKVKYIDNYIILVKFLKHQNFNTNMKKSAIDVYLNLPKSLIDNSLNLDKNKPLESFERLSKHLGMVRKVEVEYEVEVEDEVEKNKIEERKLKFANTLKPFLDTYGKEMIKDFYEYWTEPNKSNTKFKQELEKTWSLERRLKTWANNDFKGKSKQEQPKKLPPQKIVLM